MEKKKIAPRYVKVGWFFLGALTLLRTARAVRRFWRFRQIAKDEGTSILKVRRDFKLAKK